MKQSGRTETSITTIKAAVKNTENRTGKNNVTFELKKKTRRISLFLPRSATEFEAGNVYGKSAG